VFENRPSDTPAAERGTNANDRVSFDRQERRNFRSVDVPLKERMFLIGPNASGKSNLLDVFRFCGTSQAGGGLQQAVRLRGGLSKIRCLAARREPDVEILVELFGNGGGPAWEYSIGIKQEVRGYRQPYLAYESVRRDGQVVLKRPDKNDEQDRLRLTQTHLEQINANERFRQIPELLRLSSLPAPGPATPQAYRSIVGRAFPTIHSRNFLERVAKTPEKTRKSRLRRD